MKRPRDSQKSKVYAAELAAFGDPGESMTLDECRLLVEKVCRSKVVQQRYPWACMIDACGIEIADGRGTRLARGSAHRLNLPKWARCKYVVLHELAHALTDEHDGAWHDWRFAECYLYLVRVFMGRGYEDSLKREFKSRKVRHRPKRQSTMTDAQRQAARERMKSVQAAKLAVT